jgi:cytidine deaminase
MQRVEYDSLSDAEKELVEAAREARKHAYVPYTNHRVGAAVRASSGKIYAAPNLEIVSLSQSVHGERNAVNTMASAGERRLETLVCAGQLNGIPCAECRQAIWEFCGADPNVKIIAVSIDGTINVMTIGELYPYPYGPESKNVDPTKF